MPSTRVYGGATGDERWSERRAQLMGAGLELLASAEGPRAFTVRGVCRQARLTSRYFYENFGDAGELAAAIYDEEVLKLTTVTLAAMDGVPDDIPSVARAAIGAVIGQVADDPRRGRLLFSPGLVAVPAIGERRAASTRLFVDLYQDEVRKRIPTASGSSFDVAAEMMIGGLGQAIISWLDKEILLKKDELASGISDVIALVALSNRN
jgi:AcrR family transcriptional regulator